jgi:hypothetical protein
VNKLILSTGATRWDEIIQYDSKIGWKPIPNLRDAKYFDPFKDVGTITTDTDGWPTTNTIEESEIVVFGDSFVFGYGSKYRNAYYNIDNTARVKPIGAPGYNMVQSLMLMREYREKLRNKVVFWFICLGNDPMENFHAYHQNFYPNPFLKNDKSNGSWDIEKGHIRQKKRLYTEKDFNYSMHFAQICTQSPYSERIYKGIEYLLEEAKNVCDSVNSELVVFTIPNKYQLYEEGIQNLSQYLEDQNSLNPEYPDQRISNYCSEFNIPFIPGQKHLSEADYKLRDPHWNKRGNRKVSEIIINFYRQFKNDSE